MKLFCIVLWKIFFWLFFENMVDDKFSFVEVLFFDFFKLKYVKIVEKNIFLFSESKKMIFFYSKIFFVLLKNFCVVVFWGNKWFCVSIWVVLCM